MITHTRVLRADSTIGPYGTTTWYACPSRKAQRNNNERTVRCRNTQHRRDAIPTDRTDLATHCTPPLARTPPTAGTAAVWTGKGEKGGPHPGGQPPSRAPVRTRLCTLDAPAMVAIRRTTPLVCLCQVGGIANAFGDIRIHAYRHPHTSQSLSGNTTTNLSALDASF